MPTAEDAFRAIALKLECEPNLVAMFDAIDALRNASRDKPCPKCGILTYIGTADQRRHNTSDGKFHKC